MVLIRAPRCTPARARSCSRPGRRPRWRSGPRTGAVASSCGMFAVFSATFPAESSRPPTAFWIRRSRLQQHQQHPGHHQRDHQAHRQRHVPERPLGVREGEHDVHQCPTAVLRRARAACRIRTPESLILATPRELVGLGLDGVDGADRGLGLAGDAVRQDEDGDDDDHRDHDHHAHRARARCTRRSYQRRSAIRYLSSSVKLPRIRIRWRYYIRPEDRLTRGRLRARRGSPRTP